MEESRISQPGYSYPAAALFFAGGGVVTAVFSGSLAVLAVNATLAEVLAIGMLVPSFTWLVQISASSLCLNAGLRRLYIGDLARICLLGSVSLLPAALVNLLVPAPPLWLSGANVLISVAIMAIDLFRRTAKHSISMGWPVSWCLTIALNMTLFAWSSRGWWGIGY